MDKACVIPAHGKATTAIKNAAIGNLIFGHFFDLIDRVSKQAANVIEPQNKIFDTKGERIVIVTSGKRVRDKV